MGKRIGGFRRKTRYKLRKNIRERGKVSIERMLQEFAVGDLVQLCAEPSIQSGLYFPRFHGRHGKIVAQRGHAYLVEIRDLSKMKTLIVAPVHLKKVKA